MNEDEAFIRAIVDNPGDDTPRLVYADWLDDHDDPRGSYLRAEHEWVRISRAGFSTNDTSDAKVLARNLDPLWVCRVSRPPDGVCCDRVRFRECGPRLTLASLEEVNRWRKVELPSDYAAFLLNYNGGCPELSGSRFSHVRPTNFQGLLLNRLFSFHPKGNLREPGTLHSEIHRYWNDLLPSFLETKPADVEEEHIDWYHYFIPIADAVNSHRGDRVSIVLGVHDEYLGRLQLVRWDWSPGSFHEFESEQLGGSFAGFIERIVTT